jgi:hypothetical protein
MGGELERIWKEVFVVQSRCSPGTFLQRLNRSNNLIISAGRLQTTNKIKKDKIKCVDFVLIFMLSFCPCCARESDGVFIVGLSRQETVDPPGIKCRPN